MPISIQARPSRDFLYHAPVEGYLAPESSDRFENRVDIRLEKSVRKRIKQDIISESTRTGTQIGFVSGCACSIVGIPLAAVLLGKNRTKAGIITAAVVASVGWVSGALGAGIGAGVGQVAGRVKATRV